jgi:hypothetical protein
MNANNKDKLSARFCCGHHRTHSWIELTGWSFQDLPKFAWPRNEWLHGLLLHLCILTSTSYKLQFESIDCSPKETIHCLCFYCHLREDWFVYLGEVSIVLKQSSVTCPSKLCSRDSDSTAKNNQLWNGWLFQDTRCLKQPLCGVNRRSRYFYGRTKYIIVRNGKDCDRLSKRTWDSRSETPDWRANLLIKTRDVTWGTRTRGWNCNQARRPNQLEFTSHLALVSWEDCILTRI